jgi:acylphosphatase
MIRMHITVEGRVQGVGFRFYTQQQAQAYQIKGWVKNNSSGTVEMEAEGEKADMDRFLDSIRKGPSFSNVEQVNIEKLEALKGYHSFDVTN